MFLGSKPEQLRETKVKYIDDDNSNKIMRKETKNLPYDCSNQKSEKKNSRLYA